MRRDEALRGVFGSGSGDDEMGFGRSFLRQPSVVEHFKHFLLQSGFMDKVKTIFCDTAVPDNDEDEDTYIPLRALQANSLWPRSRSSKQGRRAEPDCLLCEAPEGSPGHMYFDCDVVHRQQGDEECEPFSDDLCRVRDRLKSQAIINEEGPATST